MADADNQFLPLLLDGPMQSWGHSSRFQRRPTALHPTKSGVLGMVAAAMGLAKGSTEQDKWLPVLAALRMTSLVLPRVGRQQRRMEDYHTVGGGFDPHTQPQWVPRTAAGQPDEDPTVSHRQYLLDARFGVLLFGASDVLRAVETALRDPRWGLWLGRKNCIPAALVHCGGPFASGAEALEALLQKAKVPATHALAAASFARVTEVNEVERSTGCWPDQPVTYGDGKSSGPDVRKFASRRIRVDRGPI